MQTYVDEAKNIDIALNPDSYLSRILNVNGLKDTEENRKKYYRQGMNCIIQDFY